MKDVIISFAAYFRHFKDIYIKYLLLFTCCILSFSSLLGQSLFIAGPMIGHTELITSNVWIEVAKSVDKEHIIWWQAENGTDKNRNN